MNADLLKKVFDYATGMINYSALHIASELNVADKIKAGKNTLLQLAEACQVDESSLARILRLLVKQGFFSQSDEGIYQFTELSACLLSTGEYSMRDFLVNLDESRWNAIGKLNLAVKTGKPAFDQIYGCDYFTYLTKHPEVMAHFNRGQTNLAETEDKIIASLYDFSAFPQIVDIGGGQGGLLSEVLRQHSKVHGVLFDLPETVSNPIKLLAPELTGRYEVQGGSFFEAIPAGADLYVIKRVLHDWNDEECRLILQNVQKAMSSQSRLLIIDGIIDKNNPDDLLEKIDIFLMALTTGRERTVENFEQLCRATNLVITRTISTSTMLSIIEVKK